MTGAAGFSTITGAAAGTSTYALTINGVAIYAAGTSVVLGQTLTGSTVATQINLYSGQTGVTAALSGSGALQLTAADGRDINVTEAVGAGVASGTGAGVAASCADLNSCWRQRICSGWAAWGLYNRA